MEETSQLEKAGADTRWKKGQSGNPAGRRAAGAGATLTWFARTMLEQPVQRWDGGGQRTRLAEYMLDLVARADAGDLQCRMFLLRVIDRGDRRKQAALRNSKKAKNADLREFEQAQACEISQTPPPPPPEMEPELIATVRPTVPARVETSAPVKKAPSVDAASLRRDPRTGDLLGPDGRALSREAQDRLAYPDWPHISPHLKKEERAGALAGQNAGAPAGDLAGPKSPTPPPQVFDSVVNSGTEKNEQKNESDPPVANPASTRH
ncbi:MAG: DUF5681 domain-containing protein [Rhizomicrobium sp.]|jgi:hypothetical protein